jgi:diketogulonate reductase-like aldo/keto reductase
MAAAPGVEDNLSTYGTAKTIPSLLYGTAWKKERTQELVELALESGFRGIDTACQPKHYFEPGVGAALENTYKKSAIKRDDVFLQTKYTPLRGQDPKNMPYTNTDSLQKQVMTSFEVSCANLKTDYLDSLVLHSPLQSFDDTMEVWYTFENIYNQKKARALGISNIYNVDLLENIYTAAHVKPKYVQNRFYRDTGYDVAIRAFCKAHNIVYQSFWTLTANPHITRSKVVQRLAKKYNKTPAQIFFAVVRSEGITVLTGTSSQEHMLQDLAVDDIVLEPGEIAEVKALMW